MVWLAGGRFAGRVVRPVGPVRASRRVLRLFVRRDRGLVSLFYKKGFEMTDVSRVLVSLLHRFGVVGCARAGAFEGSGVAFTADASTRGRVGVRRVGVRRVGVRRLVAVLGAVSALFMVVALTAVPAFAVAPLEAPEVTVALPVHAGEASFLGVLNPHAVEESEGGEYTFLYNKGAKCEGGSSTPAGLAFGAAPEPLPAELVVSLVANSEYTVCLSETNLAKTTTVVSPQVHFDTALPPQAPETKSPAAAVTAVSATLEGTVNPVKEAETGYHFLYSTESTCAAGASETTPEPPVKLKAKTEVQAEVAGLQPHQKYMFCLVATNIAEESVPGNEVSFETAAAPPTIDGESVSAVLPRSASLEAQVNPNNQETTYSFEYATDEAMSKDLVKLPGSAPLAAGFGDQTATVETGEALAPTSTYFYRVVAKNAKGEEATGEVKQFITGPPQTPKTEPVSEETTETATLHGVLNPGNPGNPGTFEFLYRQSPTTCQGEGQGKTTPQEAMTGTQDQTVEAAISGLLPGTQYTACLLARNEAGETSTSSPVTFTTTAIAPKIVGEPQGGTEVSSLEATNQTASSADLNAKVTPGGSGKYHFEYDTHPYTPGEPPHGTSTPGAPVAPTGTPETTVAISQHITGLSANTTYHYRLIIENPAGKAESVDHTLVYDTLAGESTNCPDEQTRHARTSQNLPDCRAYETVTPQEKNAALLGRAFFGFDPLISRDGSKVITSSVGCFGGSPSCIGQRRPSDGAPYEFQRTPSGWTTHPLAPPLDALGGAETYTTWAADPNTGTTLFSALTPNPNQQEDLWIQNANGEFVQVGPLEEEGRYQGSVSAQQIAQSSYVATADLSHFVYTALHSSWAFDHTANKHGLYEYAGTGKTHPLMVGVKGGYQNGENHELISVCSTDLGNEAAFSLAKLHGSLSQSGRTVYFEAQGRDAGECAINSEPATAPAATQVWARVDGEVEGAAHSVLISAATGEKGSGCISAECQKNSVQAPADAHFEAATPDGSGVVFASAQQLTDGASQGGSNLYESVCAEPCGTPGEEPSAAARQLFDVSEAQGGAKPAEGPQVLGLEALSPDGSHVYFVAEGVLTGAEENHNHEHAENKAPNLYVFARDAAHPKGHVAFIATLTPSDCETNWCPQERGGVANVTPDGRFLVFTSQRALTADNTRGEGPAQVYEYDAQAGALTRVSVGQDGYNDDGNEGQRGTPLAGPFAGDAKIVKALTTLNGHTAPARSDPTMSDDGSFVFFESPVALAPGALNDVLDGFLNGESDKPLFAENFYEYHGGHVHLLASVSSDQVLRPAATLLGSDVSGANVFFGSFDSLVPEDVDSELDYYDAHICSEASPCSAPRVPPGQCGEGGCQGSGSGSQSYGAPASESPSGAGNLAVSPAAPIVKPKVRTAAQVRAEKLARALRACRRKHNHKKRAACEKTARKAFGARKASSLSRATNDPRASR